MTKAALALTVYALFILIGGIIGHVQAQSTISLVMGIVFGLLLLAAAFTLYKRMRGAVLIGLSLVLLLDGFFTYRFLKTLRFLPSGLMLIISLMTLIIMVLQLRTGTTWRKVN